MTTVTGITDDDACPYCGGASGVQPMPAPPKVAAWRCSACGLDWAITVVNPQPYFDHLAATVEQLGATRSVLRQAITLADDAATLSDTELRDRLLALADRARLAQRPLGMHADQSHRFALTGQDTRDDSGGCPMSVKSPR